MADIFNNYFNNITDTLNIQPIPSVTTPEDDPILAAVDKYSSHPSIIAIKSRANSVIKFDIKAVTEDDILKEILALDDSKKSVALFPLRC